MKTIAFIMLTFVFFCYNKIGFPEFALAIFGGLLIFLHVLSCRLKLK
jgi:hypothetical protein